MLHQVEIINIDPNHFVAVALHYPLSEHIPHEDLVKIIEQVVIWPIDLDCNLLVSDYHIDEHKVIGCIYCHFLLEVEAMLRCVLTEFQKDVVLSRVLGFRRVRLPEVLEVLTDSILNDPHFLIQSRVCKGIRIGLQID